MTHIDIVVDIVVTGITSKPWQTMHGLQNGWISVCEDSARRDKSESNRITFGVEQLNSIRTIPNADDLLASLLTRCLAGLGDWVEILKTLGGGILQNHVTFDSVSQCQSVSGASVSGFT